MFFTSRKKVVNPFVVHLEINLVFEELERWIETNYTKPSLQDFDDSLIERCSRKYQIDLMPTSSTTEPFFYHRSKNIFSNYLNGFEYFLESEPFYVTYPQLRNKVAGIEWYLGNGYLSVRALLPTGEKEIISIPTSEVLALHNNGRLSVPFQNQVITFEYPHKKNGQLYQSNLGFSNRGLAYSNRLCTVKAYVLTSIDYSTF